MRLESSVWATGLLMAASACTGPRTTTQPSNASALIPAVDAIAQEVLARGETPGLTILIASGDQITYAKGFGYADLDHDVPATAETVYNIGSVTKPITATAVMQLVEDGKLDLDASITDYVPAFDTHGHRVSLRHLLHHTSGIGGRIRREERWRNHERIDFTPAEWLPFYNDEPFNFAPGEQWQYQGINYDLLGLAVERGSGQPFWTYLAERVFSAAGMASSGVCDPTGVVKHRAIGYSADPGTPAGFKPVPYYSPTQRLGGWGACASAPDLLKWVRGVTGGRIVTAASYERMSTSGTVNDQTAVGYGFGLGIVEVDGETLVFHPGAATGFRAYVGHLPRLERTVVVLANGNIDLPYLWHLGSRLARVASGLPQPEDQPVSDLEASRYVGKYVAGPVQMQVFRENGGLKASVTGANSVRFSFPALLLYQGNNEFALNWEPSTRIRFLGTGQRAQQAVLSFANQKFQLRRAD